MRRSLAAVGAVLVTSSGLVAMTLAMGASPAAAAAPLDCESVYSIQGASPRNLWALGDGGSQTSVGTFDIGGATGSLNGLGIADGGTQAFGVLPASSGNGRTIYRLDRASETTVALGAGAAGTPVTHGAVNPMNGMYYYGGFSGSSIQIYGFDTAANTSVGLVASGQIPTGGANGDWAFDQQGRLYVVGGVNGSNVVSVIDQAIPTSGPAITVTGSQITDIPAPANQPINGIAFAGNGYLYLASGAQLFEVNPSTGAILSTESLSQSGSVDLASCASPSTIRVQKDFPDGRGVAADQVTLSVTGGGLVSGNTGTTTGTDGGLQSSPDEIAGPVFGLSGTTYTIAETGAGATAGRYVSAWSCVDENSGSPIASGTGTTGSFTLPDGGATGVAALCTFTNEALRPGIELDKIAGAPTGSQVGDRITYSFVVTNTGDVPLATTAIDDPKLGAVTCPPGPLAPGDDVTCTAAPYEITQGDIDAGAVDNTATVTGTPSVPGLPTVTDSDSTTTPVDQEAALELEKRAGTPVDVNGSGLTDAGDSIAYTFTVTNTGNVLVTGITVVDPLVGTTTCDAVSLAPGISTECAADAPYVVTSADEVAGSVDNTAVATGADPAGADVTSNEDSTSTPVDSPAPALALEKFAGTPVDVNGSGLTDAGDTVTYAFEVTNTGNVPVDAVEVVDPLAGAVTCEEVSLAPGGTTTCRADAPYVVTEANELAGAVVNVATAAGEDPDGGDVTSNEDSTSTPVDSPAPALALEKFAGTPVDVNGSGLTDAGDTIAYTFEVTNTGNVPVDAVEVVDPLVGAVTCEEVSLAPGEATTCEADDVYVVTEADETSGVVTNTASATGEDPDGGPVESDPDSTRTPVSSPAPVITLDKLAGTPVDVNGSGLTDAGDTIAYTFTVTNDGDVPVTAVEVVDPLVGAVTCEEVSLAPGEATTCEADDVYVVTEADEADGAVVNVASATAEDPDGEPVESNEDTTTTPVDTPAPALTLDKRAGTPVDVNDSGTTDAGDTIAYTFTVINTGNVPLTAVGIDDPMVGGLTCPAGALAPGTSTTCTADPYVVTTDDVDAGSVENTATAQATDPDGDPVVSDPDSTTTPVPPVPALGLVKHAELDDLDGDRLADAGEEIWYGFEITNTGNITLTDVAVVDPMLGAVVCEATTLSAGQTVLCVAQEPYAVTQADVEAGSVHNEATATGTPVGGGDPVDSPPSSTDTPTDTTAALSLLKSHTVTGGGPAEAGDTVVYTFAVTNTGRVEVDSIVIDDPMLTEAERAIECRTTVLAPGESTTCQASYTVTAADVADGPITNRAVASGCTSEGCDVVPPVISEESSTTTPVAAPAPPAAPGGELPDTGGPDRVLLGGALLLVAGGLGLVWRGRRRTVA